VTVGKPKTCGIARRLSPPRPRVHERLDAGIAGFMVEWPLATPTSLSGNRRREATARSIARFGERAAPWVMFLLLQLSPWEKLRMQKISYASTAFY